MTTWASRCCGRWVTGAGRRRFSEETLVLALLRLCPLHLSLEARLPCASPFFLARVLRAVPLVLCVVLSVFLLFTHSLLHAPQYLLPLALTLPFLHCFSFCLFARNHGRRTSSTQCQLCLTSGAGANGTYNVLHRVARIAAQVRVAQDHMLQELLSASGLQTPRADPLATECARPVHAEVVLARKHLALGVLERRVSNEELRMSKKSKGRVHTSDLQVSWGKPNLAASRAGGGAMPPMHTPLL